MNKNKASAWFGMLRLHTLPLAIACVGMGNISAAYELKTDIWIVILSLLTALFLQVLANFANDLGDFRHGADNEERIGPKRALQLGQITKKDLIGAIYFTILLCVISGVWLLIRSFGAGQIGYILVFLAIGFGAIWAALAYTASKNPYGYRMLGDFFVFLFFGPVAAMGTFYLHTHFISLSSVFAGLFSGAVSTAVLNLNNIRDEENDRKTGKITLAVKFGAKWAKQYHLVLIVVAFISLFLFWRINLERITLFILILPLILFQNHLKEVKKAKSPAEYYPLLKRLSVVFLIITATVLIGLFI